MTAHEAVVKALKKTGGSGIIPSSEIPALADAITGTSWSKAVIKTGYEKAFVRAFVKYFTVKKEPDFELMKQWLERPNLN